MISARREALKRKTTVRIQPTLKKRPGRPFALEFGRIFHVPFNKMSCARIVSSDCTPSYYIFNRPKIYELKPPGVARTGHRPGIDRRQQTSIPNSSPAVGKPCQYKVSTSDSQERTLLVQAGKSHTCTPQVDMGTSIPAVLYFSFF